MFVSCSLRLRPFVFILGWSSHGCSHSFVGVHGCSCCWRGVVVGGRGCWWAVAFGRGRSCSFVGICVRLRAVMPLARCDGGPLLEGGRGS